MSFLLQEICRRFKKLTRSLSIGKKDKIDLSNVVSIEEEAPLFDCIFTAGLYHDGTTDKNVPFTRDCFPEGVSLYEAQIQGPCITYVQV